MRLQLLTLACLVAAGLPADMRAEQLLTAPYTRIPPEIDGRADEPIWSLAPVLTTHDPIASIDISLRALHSDDRLFLLVTFADPDESREHKNWQWDRGKEIYEIDGSREDVFVIKWNMAPGPADLSIRNPTPHRSDIWYWKACRTDPQGYADDKLHVFSHEKGGGKFATEVTTANGETMYLLRLEDQGEPAFRIDLKVGYQGDLLPRYRHQEPIGSRADVRAKGTWRDGAWTIEWSRALQTGHDDDVQFEPTNNYHFGVSRYEIAGRPSNPELSQPLFGCGDVGEPLALRFLPPATGWKQAP